MSDANILEFFELDVPRCANTYGETPCTAAVGVTGTKKCYNCPGTCQDPANYVAGEVLTLRWAKPTEDLPVDVRAFATIKDIRIRPQEIKPGESLGTRESGTVSFWNHRDNDVLFDNYLSDRAFNPYNQGTFFGKFVARYPNFQGYPCRYIWGEVGQSLSEMETRHYFIETKKGPDINGNFSFTFKDALKFLDGKKGVAPTPNTGKLASALSAGAGSLTLTPTGIGDAEYGNGGYISIGDEAMSYTRNTGSDTLTLTGRGLFGTEDADHEEDETVQEALEFSGVDPAVITDTLIFDYTDAPATYADLATWQTETEQNLGRLYSALIMKPTPVSKLISELILEAGLYIYTDIVNQKIKWFVLRQRPITIAVTDDNMIAGSLDYEIDEEKRVNVVYTYFGRRNPLLNLDEDRNFRGISVEVDADPIKALEDLPLSIREIRSRWIAVGNRPAADNIGESTIERYGDSPGIASFQMSKVYPLMLGASITLQSRLFETDEGDQDSAQPGIITRLEPKSTEYAVECQIIKFRKNTLADRVIIFDDNALNVNLRDVHDLIYTEPGSGDTITVYISAGVIIGGDGMAAASFDVGNWPDNTIINIINLGRIQGYGGAGGVSTLQGGEGGSPFQLAFPGGPGGLALYSRYAVNFDNSAGEIWGGGGGGGPNNSTVQGVPWTGGGGQGYLPGSPNATTEAPGTSSTGATGGGPAQAGGTGAAEAGGAAGGAIDGDSYITFSDEGDIQGTRIN